MTKIEIARSGKITDEMEEVAKAEGVPAEFVRKNLADGTLIIPRNILRRRIKPLAIGAGLRTKVNANIGTSEDSAEAADELKKLEVAVSAGADAVMDLSTGGNLDEIRR